MMGLCILGELSVLRHSFSAQSDVNRFSRHSDNLNNLVIASISLGAERTFILSPRMPSRARTKSKSTSLTGAEDATIEARNMKTSLQTRKNVQFVFVSTSVPCQTPTRDIILTVLIAWPMEVWSSCKVSFFFSLL